MESTTPLRLWWALWNSSFWGNGRISRNEFWDVECVSIEGWVRGIYTRANMCLARRSLLLSARCYNSMLALLVQAPFSIGWKSGPETSHTALNTKWRVLCGLWYSFWTIEPGLRLSAIPWCNSPTFSQPLITIASGAIS